MSNHIRQPVLLHIETATQVCSVALSKAGQILDTRSTDEKNAHSRVLTVFIDEILKQNRIPPQELNAVAVSKRPGSYTGLRIGVSTAKGLCYALDKPLIAVSTLQAMAWGMIRTYEKISEDLLFCPMIDARRMEVYSALFDTSNEQVRDIRAEIVDENTFSELLASKRVVFAGDGAPKCKSLLSAYPNAVFIDNFTPSAGYLAKIATEKFAKGEFEDVAYFEPFYLKDFIAGIPKVKGLK